MLNNDLDEVDELSAFDTFGEEFDLEHDRLKKLDAEIKRADEDPDQIYRNIVIEEKDFSSDYIKSLQHVIDDWCEHMAQYDRHPVCPSVLHAAAYIDKLIQRDITKDWLKKQLNVVENMINYFDDHPNMPHELGVDHKYNPISQARKFKSNEIANVEGSESKREHQIPVEELGRIIRQIKNVLHRSVITTQLKYGARPGQVRNLKIPELRINHDELKELYPNLGTHKMIQAHNTDDDVIYFVSTNERSGGKSEKPVLMPVDRELRNCLVKYLRLRPPVDNNWLFVRNTTATQLTTDHIREYMWKPAFHPKYSETVQFNPVTAHYARHRFGTYWKKEKDIQRNLLRYMRGDKSTEKSENDSIDTYVHSYYDDIRDPYLSQIYKFGL